MVPRSVKKVRYRYFYLFKDILSQRLYGFYTANATAASFKRKFGAYFRRGIPFKVMRCDNDPIFLSSKAYLSKKGVLLLTKVRNS